MANTAHEELTTPRSNARLRISERTVPKAPEQSRLDRAYDRVLVVMDLMRSFGPFKDEGFQDGSRVISCERHVNGMIGRVEFRARDGVYGVRFSMEVGCPTAEERKAYDQCERNDFQLRAYSLNFEGIRIIQQSPSFQDTETAQVLTALDCVFGPQ